MKKIKFYPVPQYFDRTDPVPARTNIPQWYKDITMFNKSNSLIDANILNTNEGVDGSALSVKTCGPFYDAMTAGYHFVMPEDLEITLNSEGVPQFNWESNNWFINRVPMLEIPIPPMYHPTSYTFRMMFGVSLPKGCSVLVSPPMNRMDLPFLIPFGIVDADTKFAPIDIRFYLRRDFEGVIKKGTPIFQIIPFTRESWEMEIDPSITEDLLWEHEKRRTYLSGWYGKHAQVKKEFN